MKFAIFGSGGVGGYFGGRLARAGEDVTFIARGAHLAAITEAGLRVDSIEGDFLIKPAKATDDPQSVGVVDIVFVCTKAWELIESVDQIKPLVGRQTAIIPLLNGIDHLDLLLSRFKRENVMGGLCRLSSFVIEPGHIQHVAIEPCIAFGELDNHKSVRLESLYRVFEGMNRLEVEIPVNIEIAMWEKFLFICAFSGVGAVTRQPVGVFRSVPETRFMLGRVLEEVVAVANARDIPLGEASIQSVLDRMDSSHPDVVASMQKDIMEGKPSELDAQTGAVIRMARMLDVSVPVNEIIYASLLPMELKARGK